MDDILKVAKNYSKEKHIELLPVKENNILDSLHFLFDENWEDEGIQYPYEIITYLLDCYYVLPERPDLASLFCWQAINHSYYNELFVIIAMIMLMTSKIGEYNLRESFYYDYIQIIKSIIENKK